jgi:alpha-galactosidase
MDYALLARLQLQSTSDQQQHALYPPIAAAAPLSVLPEQAASWAYPQPGMSAEETAFTLCTGLAGRLYLSGHLDRMDGLQRNMVRAAVGAYRTVRADLARSVPVWPLGPPGWSDPWTGLALVAGGTTYLTVWHRGEPGATADLHLPHLTGQRVEIDTLFPRDLPAPDLEFHPDAGRLIVTRRGGGPMSARLLRIRTTHDNGLS